VHRPTWRPLLAVTIGAAVPFGTLSACGGDTADMRGVTNAVPGTTYPASDVCKLLPVATVRSFLPGAEIDTSLPTPDSCFYGSDLGDVILTVDQDASADDAAGDPYDTALSDATDNGADQVREAPSLGDDGKVAINAADYEITAVWRRGDAVYDVQFSGWDGNPAHAIALAKQIARAVGPPS
jgi:hypothetical protein